MFTSMLGDLKGYFGKAFVLAVWLPVMLFVSAVVAVYAPGTDLLASIGSLWTFLKFEQQGIVAVEFILIVTLIAYVIHQLQVPITQFFEGYWDDWLVLKNLGRWKRKHYEQVLARLNARIDQLDGQIPVLEQGGKPTGALRVELNHLAEQRLIGFPAPGDEAQLMPTRLGNIYKAAELYPYRRYGIDAIIFWSRLRSVLPAELLDRLQEVKIAIDFLLLCSLLAVAFTITTVPYLLARGANWPLAMLCALGLPIGWLAYRAALTPALAYGELIKVAFDLYRRQLLQSFGLALPTEPAQEKQLWSDLGNFIFRNAELPANIRFEAPKPK